MLTLDPRSYMNRLCLAIIVLGTAVAIGLFLYIRSNEQKNLEHHLQLAFDEHYHAIHAEGDIIEKVLQGMRGLFNASDRVEHHEFARFANELALRHHYFKAVFWLPRVDGTVPSYPVRYAEPWEYQQSLAGWDMAAETTLRGQLEQAGKQRQLLVIPSQADQNNGRQLIRLFLPVYKPDRVSIRGFILLYVDFDDFVEAALSHRATTTRALDVAIINDQNKRLLFYHPVDPTLRNDSLTRLTTGPNHYRRQMHLLEQDWSVVIRPIPGRFVSAMSMMPWFGLFATLTITFLIAGVVNTSLTRRTYAETQVAERTRALQKSEERLARLYDIISSNADFADKTRRLLAYGCDQLGLQYGILSRISEGRYTVLYASAKDNQPIEGQVLPLEETYCGQTLHNPEITTITHVGMSGWRHLHCYQEHGLETYISTPIYTGGQLYGTLSFSGTEPRRTPFSQAEQELVQLMAQWLSMELVHIQFEDRLLEQRNTISHILESTAEAFVAVDRDHKILYANSLTGILLSLDDGELNGKTLEQTMPLLLEIVGGALSDVLNGGDSQQFDCYYRDSHKWLEVDIHPTLQGASMSLRDITEQKHNAEMLSHTLGIKNAILNSANFTIIATDVDGTIMSFNNAAERILGYSAEEMIGKQTPIVFHDPEEIALRARDLSEELEETVTPGFEAFIALARRGVPDEQEWTYIRRDGSRIPVLLSITEMTDESGNCIGFLGIGVDITERKRIERMRDEFVSTVSHELRTPLTSIRGSLGLLSGNLGARLPAQAHSLLDIAARNTERLLHLINDILDINKIESGKMAFNYEPLTLPAFLQQAIENNLTYARQFNVELVLSDALPEVDLYADEHRLMQVMNNLLSNAVKFSPAGARVEVDANLQNHFVRISVTDHGKGIDEAFRDQVFQRFSQADASDSRATGGTGLGLSIARAIVEQHGGQISYVSQPGIGTTFYFDLPVYRHQTITRIRDQIVSLAPPRPHRLLICEDDTDIAGLLQLMLARHGYQSDICHSADAARQALRDHHYDALLLDILLPDLNGLDLIRELREAATTDQLPIIVVSAVANEARNELEGGAADIVDWLNKPLDQERLLQSVNRALSHLPAKPQVLYVEDDTDLQQVIALMLQGQVELHAATTLAEARQQLAARDFDLVLLDVMLPDGSGLELLETLKDRRPPPATVIFSNRELEEETTRQVSAALLKSSTTKQTLLETLAACLRQWARNHDQPETEKESS